MFGNQSSIFLGLSLMSLAWVSQAATLLEITGPYAGQLYSNHHTHLKGALELMLEVRRRPAARSGSFENFLHIEASLSTGENNSQVAFTEAFFDAETGVLGGEIDLLDDDEGSIKLYAQIQEGSITGRLYNELSPQMGARFVLERNKTLADVELPVHDGFNIKDWNQVEEIDFVGKEEPSASSEDAVVELRVTSEPVSRVAHFYEAFSYARKVGVQIIFRQRTGSAPVGVYFSDAHWDYGQGYLKGRVIGFGPNVPTITLHCLHEPFVIENLKCMYASGLGNPSKKFHFQQKPTR